LEDLQLRLKLSCRVCSGQAPRERAVRTKLDGADGWWTASMGFYDRRP